MFVVARRHAPAVSISCATGCGLQRARASE